MKRAGFLVLTVLAFCVGISLGINTQSEMNSNVAFNDWGGPHTTVFAFNEWGEPHSIIVTAYSEGPSNVIDAPDPHAPTQV